MDQIAEVGSPIVILTGGEPLLRPDIFDIARYGTDKGLRMVMAPNGTLITESIARRMVDSGIQRISISLDGASREKHDRFRGVEGAFDGALRGIEMAKKAGLEFQINTTITKHQPGSDSPHPATGGGTRGRGPPYFSAGPHRAGQIHHRSGNHRRGIRRNPQLVLRSARTKRPLQLKATCAPHYYRILRQRAKAEGKTVTPKTHGLDAMTRGCLGGTGFCFISHRGIVQPCGFLNVDGGDVTRTSFADIWNNSETFQSLRHYDDLKGKCGLCEYKHFCGGCRARAFEATGDILAEEPLCSYQPARS